MRWLVKDYNGLTKDELYDILKLRSEVFLVEQKCLEPDVDGRDVFCEHMYAIEGDAIVSYMRILPPGLVYREPSIGRVLVRRSWRGRGMGRDGLSRAIGYTFTEYGSDAIRISGQAYLLKFYESLGFTATSDIYYEGGIPHYELLLKKEVWNRR